MTSPVKRYRMTLSSDPSFAQPITISGGHFFADLEELPAPPSVPDLPGYSDYVTNLLTHGKETIGYIENVNEKVDFRLDATYYDAIRVFYQAMETAPEASALWARGIVNALSVFRDQYVLKNNGATAGWYIFSRGLRWNFERDKDQKSAEAVILMSQNAPFAHDGAPVANTQNALYARECSYVIQCYIDRLKIDGKRRPKLDFYWPQAKDHVVQFCEKRIPHVEPFMLALSCEALIYGVEEKVFDSDIDEVHTLIDRAATFLWKEFWKPEAGGFLYTNVSGVWGNSTPTADLNLLVLPIFGWLFKETGESVYRERGDQIFAGGVRGAYLSRGKQFNQNYRWSRDYIKWTGR